MVKQVSNISAALLPEFKQGLQAPFVWLGNESEKAALMVIHWLMVAELRVAINNVRLPP